VRPVRRDRTAFQIVAKHLEIDDFGQPFQRVARRRQGVQPFRAIE
jgi:hypothetical protein